MKWLALAAALILLATLLHTVLARQLRRASKILLYINAGAAIMLAAALLAAILRCGG